jgi:hypothetical protein
MLDTVSNKLYELMLLTLFEHLVFIDSVRTHFTACLRYDDSCCVSNCQVLGSGGFKQFWSGLGRSHNTRAEFRRQV